MPDKFDIRICLGPGKSRSKAISNPREDTCREAIQCGKGLEDCRDPSNTLEPCTFMVSDRMKILPSQFVQSIRKGRLWRTRAVMLRQDRPVSQIHTGVSIRLNHGAA